MDNVISKIRLPNNAEYDIDAVTVNGFVVFKDVPADAKFTDTTYVFNTPYNPVTNKALTLQDVKDQISLALDDYY